MEGETYDGGEVSGELGLNFFGAESLDLLLELPLALLLLGHTLDPRLKLDYRVQPHLSRRACKSLGRYGLSVRQQKESDRL